MKPPGGIVEGMAKLRSATAYAERPARGSTTEGVATPLWREGTFPLDWFALRASPVYYGYGVAQGRGEPVVVVPGFLASDASMFELYGWLGRIGYRPYFSDIGRNADCPNHIATLLLDTIGRVYVETGQRVKVIGHSLGGMLARSIALDNPEIVERVISLGSPFRDSARTHPSLMAATEALRRNGSSSVAQNMRPSCFSGQCSCAFGRNMSKPETYRVGHFAIYSRYDGVVDWRSCMEEDAELNDEVNCTHIGMAFHPGVYRVLARRLTEEL